MCPPQTSSPLDPLSHATYSLALVQVEAKVEEWVESQIVKHTDSKWGNLLSNKNFLVSPNSRRIGPGCYIAVILLLHCCYMAVTLLLHCCYIAENQSYMALCYRPRNSS